MNIVFQPELFARFCSMVTSNEFHMFYFGPGQSIFDGHTSHKDGALVSKTPSLHHENSIGGFYSGVTTCNLFKMVVHEGMIMITISVFL